MTDRSSSVMDSDADVLAALLAIHAPGEPRILDLTHNRGTMWRGLPYRPVTNDLDPSWPTDHHEDFRALPAAWSACWDVLVFDPPHLTESGHAKGHDFSGRYGLATDGLGAESIGGLFAPFLREAARVLVPNGVVLAKVSDMVHRSRLRLQHVELINAATATGWTVCDLAIKRRASAMNDPKWQRVLHLRAAHSYWIVLRNGPKCYRSDGKKAA